MALRIIREDEVLSIETLVATIYGPPGVGKSSLAMTSRRPLLLDFDRGAHRAVRRGDVVPVETWDDLRGLDRAAVAGYDTLVVDTVGRALDVMAADIIRSNSRMSRGAGALSLQGFGELKARFARWIQHLRGLGVDVVLIAHAEEKDDDGRLVERLDIQGSSKAEVHKVSDAIARLRIAGEGRELCWSPTSTSYGKDPAGLGVVTVPDISARADVLADMLEQIKGGINSQTDAQCARAAHLDEWRATCREVARADKPADLLAGELTALTARCGDDRAEKTILLEEAREAGFSWPRGGDGFRPTPGGPRDVSDGTEECIECGARVETGGLSDGLCVDCMADHEPLGGIDVHEDASAGEEDMRDGASVEHSTGVSLSGWRKACEAAAAVKSITKRGMALTRMADQATDDARLQALRSAAAAGGMEWSDTVGGFVPMVVQTEEVTA